MSMRVLFIDEDEAAIVDGKTLLEDNGYNCKQIDFAEFDTEFLEFSPHIVVLDMMDGGEILDATGDGGKNIFDKIWGHRFCPIVVYSAVPDLVDAIDADRANHPLVDKVAKGRNSEEKLYASIQKYSSCVEGITKISSEVNNALHSTLWEIAKHLVGKDGVNEADAIQYLGRRRIAALMDDASTRNSVLAPWEKYIYPALGENPKTADIILHKSSGSYLLVLTPSCDLVNSGNQCPKVTRVLCAECENADLLLQKFPGSNKKDVRKKLESRLTQGYLDELIPLSELPGVFDPMVANLKNLVLVPYDSIGKDKEFEVKASIDSPFREQIVWAYLNNSGRPGVPDIDCKCWVEQYVPKEEKKGEGK